MDSQPINRRDDTSQRCQQIKRAWSRRERKRRERRAMELQHALFGIAFKRGGLLNG